MSNVSQKCQYGIRAMFELSKHWNSRDLVKLQDIAKAQSIPRRFLENILNQLRQGNFVESRRGKDGGFRLSRDPSEISIGAIIRFIDSSLFPVSCSGENPARPCKLRGQCVFLNLWQDASNALGSVYDAKSLQDLVDDNLELTRGDDNRILASAPISGCDAAMSGVGSVECRGENGEGEAS